MLISMIASGTLAFGFLQQANRTEKIFWWVLMNALLLFRLADAIAETVKYGKVVKANRKIYSDFQQVPSLQLCFGASIVCIFIPALI